MKTKINILAIPFFMLFAFTACNEQTSYEINGIAKDLEDGSEVILENAQTNEMISTTKLVDGKFKFTGSVEQAHFAFIYLGRLRYMMVLENANYEVVRDKHYTYIDGGKINKAVFGYTLEPKYQEMVREHRSLPSPFEGVDRMDKEAIRKASKVSNARRKKERTYITSYLNKIITGDYPSLTKLFALCNITDWDNYGWDKKLELFKEYENELGTHPLIVFHREGILKAKKIQEINESVSPGKPFKDIIAQTRDGKQLRLSEVVAKNKYTLLEMWASWCGPCRAEFPHLKKAYKYYHKKGFEIFALSLDSDEESWFKAMDKENVPWINVVDYKAWEADGPKAYGVTGIPASFLIDQNGTIIASMQQVRGFALDEKLEELLGN